MEDTNLKFLNFYSIVEPTFWHKLCQIKLEKDMLEEKERTVTGSFLNSVGMSFHLDYTSFESSGSCSKLYSLKNVCTQNSNFTSNLEKMPGKLINLNTLQKFKDLDKSLLVQTESQTIWKAIENGEAIEDPSVLNTFFLITFADLKSYDFYYWFCFPALSSLNFSIVEGPKLLYEQFDNNQIQSLLTTHSSLTCKYRLIFSAQLINGELISKPLETLVKCLDPSDNDNLYICLVDPSTQDYLPGWILRNVLALIAYYRNTSLPVNIISLRVGARFKSSFIMKINIHGDINDQKWVGWERNTQGKFGSRKVNLRNSIDPMRLAESSVDLNLKLMKWRLLQDINLEIIKLQKCLLLGAGTLGCSLARCLMGWGVRHITFVDSGEVSFSNPVRQSLYTYKDCDLGKGAKKKATAASNALKNILPTVVSEGVILDIPMPGHPTGSMKDVEKLHKLIEGHDVVFLLTDSRESRWLPTVICSALNKLAFTVALGFDSYLIMRHGVECLKSGDLIKLGCYFCNDVTAPGISKFDRTLDQQCTVTRPGVSYIASSLAVELFVSFLQDSEKCSVNSNYEGILGTIPHSIRGFLSNFNQIMLCTPSFEQCIACSLKVKNEYLNNQLEFFTNVFALPTFLEKLLGLDVLQKQSEMAEILELSDEDLETE